MRQYGTNIKMKFQLLEEKEIIKDEFIAYTTQHCKTYIKQFKNRNLHFYRGIQIDEDAGEVPKYLIDAPFDDRMPKDTPLQVHQIFDQLLYERFGWRPRSSGVFVSGNKFGVLAYGKVYEVYPTDGFKYIWSPEIQDFFDYYVDNEPHGWGRNNEKLKAFLEGVADTYEDTNIKNAINYGHEIMIKCAEYAGELVDMLGND